MSKDISSLPKDLIQALEKEFILNAKDLGLKIQNQMVNEVQSEVYNKYKQKMYKRKGIHGGLQDIANMPLSLSSEIDHKGISLEVRSERKDGSRDVSALVEGGDGTKGIYYYKKTGKEAKKPRRFVRSTYQKIKIPVRTYIANMVKKVVRDINGAGG